MIDLELEWMVGGKGGERRKDVSPKRLFQKKRTTPWLLTRRYISGNEQVTNQKWIYLKSGRTVKAEPMSETVRQFFSQETNGLDKTSFAITDMSWYLRHSIFSKPQSLSVAGVNLSDDVSSIFNVNDALKRINKGTRKIIRHSLFDATLHLKCQTLP